MAAATPMSRLTFILAIAAVASAAIAIALDEWFIVHPGTPGQPGRDATLLGLFLGLAVALGVASLVVHLAGRRRAA